VTQRAADRPDVLQWLQQWYRRQANGEWEHEFGIKLSTLDNPGWDLRLDLAGTELQDATFERISIDRTDDDWIDCWIGDRVFNAVGGPGNLTELLDRFRRFAEGAS
jgi:hypothetical protein